MSLFKSLMILSLVSFYDVCEVGKDEKNITDFYTLATQGEKSPLREILQNNNYTAELVDGNINVRTESGGLPRQSTLLIQAGNDDETKFYIVSARLKDLGEDATNEIYQERLSNPKKSTISIQETMTEPFDWMSLNLQYNENYKSQQNEQAESAEAEAQAAFSNKFTNADGTKDYAGYVEDKGTTEVKTTQQNPQVDYDFILTSP